MRILHIDTGRELRGGQFQVLLLLAGLEEAGHQCVLLTREGSPLWQAANKAGIKTLPASIGELWRTSKQGDLVHAHDARAHSMAALVSRLPFVVSRRVAFPVKQSLLSRFKYARARRYLAVSRFVAHRLRTAHVPAEKIDVVHDGVEFPSARTEWSPSFPAVALASADPRKGRSLVERAAHIAGIPVLFSNHLNQDFLRASMFVYITQCEGLGSAALLAMAIGVPVIGSRVGGLAEVFEDKISGLYVRNEPNEIALAMKSVRENSALAATLMKEGTQRVKAMFTKQHLIQNTIASYERALAD